MQKIGVIIYYILHNRRFITLHRDSTTQVNTLCERELSTFILVAPVLLFDKPCIISNSKH